MTSVSTDRVYKVDSIAITEEGFVDVTATHTPVRKDSRTNDIILELMQGWEDEADFVTNGHRGLE